MLRPSALQASFAPPSLVHRCRPWTVLAVVLLSTGWVQAQEKQATQAAGATPIAPPEELVFDTKDGVVLHATFFPGTKGKESVPVILLHPYKSNRHSFGTLPKYLQETHGFAVITVDLRGHGESTSVKSIDGKVIKISADTLRPLEYAMMVKYDMSTVFDQLLLRNEKGELNIDKLSIVGAEMGASVAFLGAVVDWSWPVLATGKQGQYVKAIALLSPEVNFKTLNMSAAPLAIKPDDPNLGPQNVAAASLAVRQQVAVYIGVGKGTNSAVANADRVHKLFQRKPPKDDEEPTLFYDEKETKLQGTALVTEKSLEMEKRLGAFIEFKAEQQPFPWASRKNPLGAAAGT